MKPALLGGGPVEDQIIEGRWVALYCLDISGQFYPCLTCLLVLFVICLLCILAYLDCGDALSVSKRFTGVILLVVCSSVEVQARSPQHVIYPCCNISHTDATYGCAVGTNGAQELCMIRTSSANMRFIDLLPGVMQTSHHLSYPVAY